MEEVAVTSPRIEIFLQLYIIRRNQEKSLMKFLREREATEKLSAPVKSQNLSLIMPLYLERVLFYQVKILVCRIITLFFFCFYFFFHINEKCGVQVWNPGPSLSSCSWRKFPKKATSVCCKHCVTSICHTQLWGTSVLSLRLEISRSKASKTWKAFHSVAPETADHVHDLILGRSRNFD